MHLSALKTTFILRRFSCLTRVISIDCGQIYLHQSRLPTINSTASNPRINKKLSDIKSWPNRYWKKRAYQAGMESWFNTGVVEKTKKPVNPRRKTVIFTGKPRLVWDTPIRFCPSVFFLILPVNSESRPKGQIQEQKTVPSKNASNSGNRAPMILSRVRYRFFMESWRMARGSARGMPKA